MDVKILILTHKPCWLPSDSIYYPLHVGRKNEAGFGLPRDNTGNNISSKNELWSELTGVYWGWKNLDCDYFGVVHYRRFFASTTKHDAPEMRILNRSGAEQLLSISDIILPARRNYIVMTLSEHFNNYDFSRITDLTILKETIKAISPEYLSAYDVVMSRRWGHMCNMFLMRKELSDSFCTWAFSVLEEFEHKIDNSRRRIIGYVAEHLLDIWIEKNHYKYTEINTIALDKKNEFYRRVDFLFRILKFKKRYIRLDS